MRAAVTILGIVLLSACSNPSSKPVEREVLSFVLNDSTRALVQLGAHDGEWIVRNGGEAIRLERISDGLYHVPVFNGSIKMINDTQGTWTDSLRPQGANGPYQVDVERLYESIGTGKTIAGTWDVWFGENSLLHEGEARSQLDLQTVGNEIHGTMRTPTGDYRYLSGSFDGAQLVLQTFDGAHLFRFDAILENGGWTQGNFYSGNHYHVNWSGLPAQPWASSASVERIETPLDSLIVRCIDRAGNPITLSLLPEAGHVKIVDILGTWCPNCMDEVRLLSSLNGEHLERLSVAFERPNEAEAAYQRIDDFTREMDVNWDVILGGAANKQVAATAFPFLEEVISFPTTLFIQHDGTVHIHSGFNGPATSDHHQTEIATFNRYSSPVTSLENR